jgi:hypothetical protein
MSSQVTLFSAPQKQNYLSEFLQSNRGLDQFCADDGQMMMIKKGAKIINL